MYGKHNPTLSLLLSLSKALFDLFSGPNSQPKQREAVAPGLRARHSRLPVELPKRFGIVASRTAMKARACPSAEPLCTLRSPSRGRIRSLLRLFSPGLGLSMSR